MTSISLLSISLGFFAGAAITIVQTALFLAVGTLGGLGYFLHRFGLAWAMHRWPQTRGLVITAEMRRGKKKTSDGCLLYEPVLRYSYAVEGRTFESSRFTHRSVGNAANLTTQFVTRIRKNAEVPVYYHPRNPAEAVVQPMSWHGAALGAVVCALVLMALAARLLLA